jgi:ABC-type multidrug transport system ATPase subunit
MIVGLEKPTQGAIFVDGVDVRHAHDVFQRSLGLCPQHNVLWDLLTVEEHLQFFCRLKGLSDPVFEAAHVTAMLEDLGMTQQAHTLAGTLSGGQKRRLCCGMALVCSCS